MRFAIYQASRVGGRKYNQDRVAYAYNGHSLLMVLADGMGGHLHGEIAAQLAIKVFTGLFREAAMPLVSEPRAFLRDAMQQAHDAILRYARERQLGGNPGTTCVAALIQESRMCWAHAGDSRLYLLRGREVVARTRDHSMVQQWVDWGIIGIEEIRTHPDRNKITNCLGGVEEMFVPELSEYVPLQPGDLVLLCSDGLWGSLSGEEMAGALAEVSLRSALESLMDEAVHRDGPRADNITAVVAHWGVGGEIPVTPVPLVVELNIE